MSHQDAALIVILPKVMTLTELQIVSRLPKKLDDGRKLHLHLVYDIEEVKIPSLQEVVGCLQILPFH